MDMTSLRMFLTLSELGNMTRAASELHLTQPAVSAQLARLEDELGYRLFDRSSRGVRLTEAGHVYHRFATEALDSLARGKHALDQLAGLEAGELAIGGGATATTYLLPPLLGQFHARFPAIRLFVREQGSVSVAEAVIAGDLDLGVVTRRPELEDTALKELAILPWRADELRLIVPPDHALSSRTSFHWADLDGLPLVLFEAGTAVRDLLDAWLRSAGIVPEIVMELRSIESIKQMVSQGIGAAFVSRFALSAPAHGLVSAQGHIERQLAVIHRADRSLSPAAQAFLSTMLQA